MLKLLEDLALVIGDALAPIVRRLATLEARPVPRDGTDGLHGKDGAPGVDGKAGINGLDGQPGHDGKDGADGKPGADGLHGKDGAPGQDGDKGLDGQPGKDGLHGKDGAHGRDATQLEVLHAIDLAKPHPRGTHARHAGGVIRAFRDTGPLDPALGLEAAGWHVVLNGVAECTLSVDDTGRHFKRRELMTDGRSVELAWYTPAMVHRGVWTGGEHKHGDVVTWAGSQWHAQQDTATKPGDADSHWQLVAKRGRDGKDGRLQAPRSDSISLTHPTVKGP